MQAGDGQNGEDRHVRIARSAAECDSIFRFRYHVFAEHLARMDLDGADHAARTLTDSLDPVSTHFYVGEPGQPRAALTMSPLASAAVPRELASFLDLSRLEGAAPLEQMMLANWLLAEPTEAGSAMVASLIAAVCVAQLDRGVEIVLTFCRPGMVNFYERLGFEQYRDATELKGIGLRCPLLLVLRDAARLKAVRSPLHRVLRHASLGENADAVRLRLEPLVDMFQAAQILVVDELWLDSGARLVSRTRPRLFDGLAEDSVRQVMKLAGVISCHAGQAVTRLGETSDDMFLVVDGQFSGRPGGTGPVRLLGQGDLFGELEHLSGRPRAEAVICTAPGHIAALRAEALFGWMQQNPAPGVMLATNLARLLALRITGEGEGA